MSFFNDYCKTINNSEIEITVKKTVSEIFDIHLKNYNYRNSVNGLLFGEIQSGKTGQVFGVISAAADRGFELFVLLTSDNKRLQEQTFVRTLESLSDFCVCTEVDFLRCETNKFKKPVIIVLKKNVNILKKWRNFLGGSDLLNGRPVFIIDDEADSASLNTKVNKNEQSRINKNIEDIKKLSSGCIYLQVTATPQAVFLQKISSGFKPEFMTYFNPGRDYLGGDFFFSKPGSFPIEITDDELSIITDENEIITEDLSNSILTFLISIAHLKVKNDATVANCIIHPSVKIEDHEIVEKKITEFLNDLSHNFEDNNVIKKLQYCYNNLYKSKPDIISFDKSYNVIYDLLINQKINVLVLNSTRSIDLSYEKGFNIIIGALTLGRGVTFPMLLTVYYARKSKVPQMDTYWQHCRMFGYDRDRGLMRVFIPSHQLKIFQDINNSQKALVKQVKDGGFDSNHLLCLSNIKPTRSNVIDKKGLELIVGGVNYFASDPINENKELLEALLLSYKDQPIVLCAPEDLVEILNLVYAKDPSDWDNKSYIDAINTLVDSGVKNKFRIAVRYGRNLTKGTGTMLSENDRALTKKYDNDTILFLYKLNGDIKKGWNGDSIWMPNIKLPSGYTFYYSV